MVRTEQIQTRIESLTTDLAPAVQAGQGAQFAMLMSMIATNQLYYQPEAQAQPLGGFELPPVESVYPEPNSLYNGEVVERLNDSVHQDQRGEFAYVNSHLHTESLMPVNGRAGADYFAKIGLISGGAMLEEIETATHSVKVSV
ncbi:MAG: hypothetical protein ACPGPF_00625 [Pontibacterium sp.]